MNIDIITLPVYEGCNIEGVDSAPRRLVEAGIIDIFSKKHTTNIYNDIANEQNAPQADLKASQNIKYRDKILSLNKKIYERVSNSISKGNFPICIGGDHSIATGSISGCSKQYGGNISVIWFDAHPDLNTPESSPSKNFHGMSLGAALGWGDKQIADIGFQGAKVGPEMCYLLGIRSIDKGEVTNIKDNNIYTAGSNTIERLGAKATIEAIFADIEEKSPQGIHFSIDVDVITPEEFAAVNVPSENGVSFSNARKIIEMVLAHPKVVSLDFVEYNPLKDKDNQSLERCRELIETISDTLWRRDQQTAE